MAAECHQETHPFLFLKLALKASTFEVVGVQACFARRANGMLEAFHRASALYHLSVAAHCPELCGAALYDVAKAGYVKKATKPLPI